MSQRLSCMQMRECGKVECAGVATIALSKPTHLPAQPHLVTTDLLLFSP